MRRISKITAARRRTTWLAIPASGIDEVGHGPGGALPLLTPTRHEYVIRENVSRKLKLAYYREALRTCQDKSSLTLR